MNVIHIFKLLKKKKKKKNKWYNICIYFVIFILCIDAVD